MDIYTLAYISPLDYQSNIISIDNKIQEITLINNNIDKTSHINQPPESWILNKCIYNTDNNDNYSKTSQYQIWDEFLMWFRLQYKSDKQIINCITLGTRDSGKSYTLFGDYSIQNKGIIPRFISHIFDNNENYDVYCVDVSMTMIQDDMIIDLLDPPNRYYYNSSITYSNTLGPIILPIKTNPCLTIEMTMNTLHLGILTASTLLINSEDIYNNHNIIITFKIYSKSKIYILNFIELSHYIFYSINNNIITDRFTLHSTPYHSGYILQNYFNTKFKKQIITNNNSNNNKVTNNLYYNNLLTYILQDIFYLRTPVLPVNGIQSSSSFVISCLKVNQNTTNDILITLNFMHKLHEHVIECIHQSVLIMDEFREFDMEHSNELITNEKYKQNKLLYTITNLPITTESISLQLQNECETIESILSQLNTEIDYICTGTINSPSMSYNMDDDSSYASQGSSTKYSKKKTDRKKMELEELIAFYETKLYTLTQFRLVIVDIEKVVLANRFDTYSVIDWLLKRGLSDIQLNIIRKKTDGNNAEKLYTLSKDMPWDRYEKPLPLDMSRYEYPCLIPIVSGSLGYYYFHIEIPGGHMAITNDDINPLPITELLDTANLIPPHPITIKGVRNCKMFQLHGGLIESKHCIFFRIGSNIKLRPFYSDDGIFALVEVNGVQIEGEVPLNHGDIVRIGMNHVFYVHIPKDDDVIENTTVEKTQVQILQDKLKEEAEARRVIIKSVPLQELTHCRYDISIAGGFQKLLFQLLSTTVSDINHITHVEVIRELVSVTKKSELTDAMKMQSYIPSNEEIIAISLQMSNTHRTCLCEALLAVEYSNMISTQLKRGVRYHVILRESVNENSHIELAEYRGSKKIQLNGKIYSLFVLAEVMEKGSVRGRGDNWLWPHDIFIQRFALIRSMYIDYIYKYKFNIDLLNERYNIKSDPFLDPSDRELIGVCYLNIDSLFYLMDIRERLTIITFKGNNGGILKLTVRCWIDKVETIPPYISIDKECKLSDFIGRKCILRFYFDSVYGINPLISNDVHAIFKFFCHPGQYKTSRKHVENEEVGDRDQYLNCAKVIEQVITPDFLEYIQKKTIEIELWGSRIGNTKFTPVDVTFPVICDPKIPVLTHMALSDVHSLESKHKDKENELSENNNIHDVNDSAVLKKQIKELSALLEKTERNYRRAQRIVDSIKNEDSVLGIGGGGLKAMEMKEAVDKEITKNKKLFTELKKTKEKLAKAEAKVEELSSVPVVPVKKSSMCIVS